MNLGARDEIRCDLIVENRISLADTTIEEEMSAANELHDGDRPVSLFAMEADLPSRLHTLAARFD